MSDRRLECEIVVVGAGPAGLAAASEAAQCGCRVLVLDDSPWLGGQIWRGEQASRLNSQARHWLARFRQSGAEPASQSAVIAAPRARVLLAESPSGSVEVHWQKLILATGARELFLPFPGWTLPGVVGPGGLQVLVKNGWPVRAQRVVVAGSGPLLLAAADGLKKHDAQVLRVVEQAPWSCVFGFGLNLLARPAKLVQGMQIKLRLLGVPYNCGVWPVRAEGADRVQRVTLSDGRRTWIEECDLLACGFGLVPNIELPLLLDCAVQDGFVSVDEWQATSVSEVFCVGEPTGIGGVDCALVEGRIAGLVAADQVDAAHGLFAQRQAWHRFRAALKTAFALRRELTALAEDDTLVCRCEDVAFERLRQFAGWRDAKIHTRCGMGSCQGRICGAATRQLFGWEMESVRPPVVAARVSSLISQS